MLKFEKSQFQNSIFATLYEKLALCAPHNVRKLQISKDLKSVQKSCHSRTLKYAGIFIPAHSFSLREISRVFVTNTSQLIAFSENYHKFDRNN